MQMCRFIAYRHQQQDNQHRCTLHVLNMCLLFGDNQTWFHFEGGGGGAARLKPEDSGDASRKRKKHHLNYI